MENYDYKVEPYGFTLTFEIPADMVEPWQKYIAEERARMDNYLASLLVVSEEEEK